MSARSAAVDDLFSTLVAQACRRVANHFIKLMSDLSVFTMPAGARLAPDDFQRAAQLLLRRTGIVLPLHKKEMAERRLSIQADHAGLDEVRALLGMLECDAQSPQWVAFINAFTINHTAFFREAHHFEVLAQFARSRRQSLKVWTCACSTGEEAYSIAMTLRECGSALGSGVCVQATDIDTNAVRQAEQGIYRLDRLTPVPSAYVHKYFQRGVGSREGFARTKPALRELIEFNTLNLLSPSWPQTRFDAIFCRNTMIYFDKSTQARLLERFARVLKPGGLLFVGHSENMTHLTTMFRLQGKTVYALI